MAHHIFADKSEDYINAQARVGFSHISFTYYSGGMEPSLFYQFYLPF